MNKTREGRHNSDNARHGCNTFATIAIRTTYSTTYPVDVVAIVALGKSLSRQAVQCMANFVLFASSQHQRQQQQQRQQPATTVSDQKTGGRQ